MVAREYLFPLLLSGLFVLLLDDLGIVFQNARQSDGCEELLPKVVGLESVQIGWVSSPIIPALVEWQEP